MGNTSIEWTDRTWNPTRGCSRISPGCVNCYAETIAARFSGPGGPFHLYADRSKVGSKWTGKVGLIEEKLLEPLSWRKPCRVFVNSMSDLFHENLPDESIDRVFAVMALTPHITYQVLTKRAGRMREYLTKQLVMTDRETEVLAQAEHTGKIVWDSRGSERHNYFGCGHVGDVSNRRVPPRWPLPNVWLGVSVEDQQRADERVEDLRNAPAAVRFISQEPQLESITYKSLKGLHWIIIGGESGPGARPFDIAWARQTVQQCKAAGVPVFVKQLGRFPNGSGFPEGFDYRKRDRKGGDMAEWPHDLRVREFPW